LGAIGGKDREGGGLWVRKEKSRQVSVKLHREREREGVMGKVSFFFLLIQT
jgi:hypothetical protein